MNQHDRSLKFIRILTKFKIVQKQKFFKTITIDFSLVAQMKIEKETKFIHMYIHFYLYNISEDGVDKRTNGPKI